MPNEMDARADLPPAPAFLCVDDTLLAVDKPSGLPSVPGRGEHLQDCAASRVQSVLPDARIVHRLDMATSGVMLMARGAHWQRVLSGLFAERSLCKRYVAIASGLIEADAGEIDLPLIADWPRRPLQKVDAATGKPALTRYRVLARNAVRQHTRVELEPVTGRTHQLRVHLQALGHPILGDTLYAPVDVQAMAPRLMLHAQSISLRHPASGEPVCISAAVPF